MPLSGEYEPSPQAVMRGQVETYERTGDRRPLGIRIHWAGSETSDIWNGYMDGAVRSGRRAADEILAELS
jgi:monoamine oxidase